MKFKNYTVGIMLHFVFFFSFLSKLKGQSVLHQVMRYASLALHTLSRLE